jgi:hypothetical protein
MPAELTESRTTTASKTRAEMILMFSMTMAFLLVMSPGIIGNAPLADDYFSCFHVAESGLSEVIRGTFERHGLVRPARFLEIVTIGTLCKSVPFFLLIMLPLLLTLGVALVLQFFLKEMGVPKPWPTIGAVIWLLQPLGTEAALWPSALHIPLGLILVLASLSCFRRGSFVGGILFGAGACFNIEQAIFALPIAVWLVTPGVHRIKAAVLAGMVTTIVLVLYSLFPGTDPRPPLSVAGMMLNVITEPFFYIRFPVTSLGLHSVPVAIYWALPMSILFIGMLAFLGFKAGPLLFTGYAGDKRLGVSWLTLGGLLLLVLAINFPAMVTVPHPNAPRVFTPTWLLIAGVLALAGARVNWRRPAAAGALSGALAGGLLLSIAFSASVRYQTGKFDEAALAWISDRVESGNVVAVCDAPRAVVRSAPNGDFHVHALLDNWMAGPAMWFHTGINVRFQINHVWDETCSAVDGADVVFTFDEVSRGAGGR